MQKQTSIWAIVIFFIFSGFAHADDVAPVISNLQAIYVSDTVAMITWETDELSTSTIHYDLFSNSWGDYSFVKTDAELEMNHSILITNLNSETAYYFRTGSEDAMRNGPSNVPNPTNPSEEMTFTTNASPDTTAPQITGVTVTSTTDTTAVIEWDTDEPGNSLVQYSNPLSDIQGDSGSNTWGNYPLDEIIVELVTHHKMMLTGLAFDRIYFFRVSSVDLANNGPDISVNDKNPSIEYNFITPSPDTPSIIMFGDDNYPGDYPKIDITNNTIDISYDEENMKNATLEGNYIFEPILDFSDPGNSIVVLSNENQVNKFRLSFVEVPPNTIIKLTISEEITDADGFSVIPSTVIINDNDADDLPDDWEIEFGLNPFNSDSSVGEGKTGDFDKGGASNYEEFLNGTDPSDPSDDDNDDNNGDNGCFVDTLR